MKHDIDKLIEAIRLHRHSDCCGPGSPSRDEAIMIIKQEWAAKVDRIEALEKVAVVMRKVRKISGESPAVLRFVRDIYEISGEALTALDKLDTPADGKSFSAVAEKVVEEYGEVIRKLKD